MPKKRADILLVERGLCESRSRAQRIIMAGQVRSGPDHVIRKASEMLPEQAELSIDEPCPYVSRGAYKLLAALDEFQPELTNATVLDIGASTGGFTDLLLQRGAGKVYAVDVGHGQLHYRLRQDSRVVSLEKTNARELTHELVSDPIDVLVVDVSFISVTKVLPPAALLLRPGAWVFVLVKPQFESERKEVAKGGIVRDPEVRRRCVSKVLRFGNEELGWRALGSVASPLKGRTGNQEYIAVFRKTQPAQATD